MKTEYDLIIVGAGVAGMLAAAAAIRLGYEVLVVEASNQVGGSNAGARGAMWLPATELAAKAGIADSESEALDYLNEVLGTPNEISTTERRRVFIETAPKLTDWLLSSHLPLTILRKLPDHCPNYGGSRDQGRVLATHHLPITTLGAAANKLRVANTFKSSRVDSLPLVSQLRKSTSLTRGESLAAALFKRIWANKVAICYRTKLVDLIIVNKEVRGIVAETPSGSVAYQARKGVLLACGGFEGNQQLREKYLPTPTDISWSLNGAINTGTALEIASNCSLALANLENAWWVPVIWVDGKPYRIDHARRAAHSLLVDQAGDRFYNETAPAAILGDHMYARARGVAAVPCFLIMDNRHRNTYNLGPWKAGSTPKKAIESGDIFRTNTLNDLAEALDIDRAGLIGTVVRFNGFAARGKDTDFSRGDSVWDRFGLGSGKRKNPSLGKVDKAPYWAVRVSPGDTGTKGGLLVDTDAIVQHCDGSPIKGLYACGGAAASMYETNAPGPGAGLSEALVQAYRAIIHLHHQR